MFEKLKSKLTHTQIIVMGFLLIVLVGGFLLCLPISSAAHHWTPLVDAMFTATSATCVTGLIVFDTLTYWSLFGQIVILLLIQTGGLGLMTMVTLIFLFLKKRIGLNERRLLMQSAGSMAIGGVVKLIRRIAFGTLIFEGVGTILLCFSFVPRMGFAQGLYKAVFHSVSAFCNAGFDLMGNFRSLTEYTGDFIVNFTIMSLIVIGGIGFIVWNDILTKGFHFSRYELHTKIVLVATGFLIVVPAILFFLFENNHLYTGMPLPEKIMAALFQSVTPRTAGFNTIPLPQMTDSSSLLTMILMFIGGSPGSTAGGIKTTTLVVLIMGIVASSRHDNSINVFKKRLDDGTLRTASAISTIYLLATLAAIITICAIEPLSLRDVSFEVTSAIGTVGLSMGITGTLGVASKLIIMFLMFGGRVGILTLALFLGEKRNNVPVNRPLDRVMIG